MKTCEICNEKKGDRIIAGMSICNNCFARLQGLRNGETRVCTFINRLI